MKYVKRKGENVKVRNATPIKVDDIQFKSKLEAYVYSYATESGIPLTYEEKSYTLLPKFTYGNENVRAITYKPDFIGNGFVIEAKGHPNDSFPLRAKLFKYYLANNEPFTKFYIVRTQKEVRELINKIKEEQNENETEKIVQQTSSSFARDPNC